MSGLISGKVEFRINHFESDNQSNTSVGIENMLWLDWKRNHYINHHNSHHIRFQE